MTKQEKKEMLKVKRIKVRVPKEELTMKDWLNDKAEERNREEKENE